MIEFERELSLLHEFGLKDSPLRREYETKVHALKELPATLRAEGHTEEQIARIMHAKRRELGKEYKEAQSKLNEIRAILQAAISEAVGN